MLQIGWKKIEHEAICLYMGGAVYESDCYIAFTMMSQVGAEVI